ncbi:MAG: rhomboid family intramembrane serine protease [Rhodobacteraceae bacterium]|nr:rhomboid family intramembrane serine protease [Paracoccaceae bacterium]
MQPGHHASPINQLPPVVWLILLPIVAMELVLNAGSLGLAGGAGGIGWRNEALQRFALSPAMLDYMLASRTFSADDLMRFFTYSVVHGSLMHAVWAGVFILAMGKFVGEVFSGAAVLAVYVASVVISAVVYSLIPGLVYPLFGAYPGAFGLIGAFTFILWTRLGAVHANRNRAFSLIGFLLGIRLVFAIFFGSSPDWIAEVAGFATGFGLSFLVGPGGPAHMIARIRQR